MSLKNSLAVAYSMKRQRKMNKGGQVLPEAPYEPDLTDGNVGEELGSELDIAEDETMQHLTEPTPDPIEQSHDGAIAKVMDKIRKRNMGL